MSDDDKNNDMTRSTHEKPARKVEGMSPDEILAESTAHLGRTENRKFEDDDGLALLSFEEQKCGDGRDPRLERFGIFGGSLGLIASAIANLDAVEKQYGERSITVYPEIVIRAMIDKLGGISCHTDTHNGPGVHSGCGHVARIIRNPEKYGLTGRFGEAYVKFLKELNQEKHPEHEVDSVSYSKNHDEIAVIQVMNAGGKRLRVRAHDQETGTQVFVVHRTEIERATDAFGKWLFDYTNLSRLGVKEADFRKRGVETIIDQTFITGSELAPNFRIIQVEPTANDTLKIEPVGTVPTTWAMGMFAQQS